MSGYLQRMALSALNPGGSIHPVLGSVFSAPKYGRTTDTFQWEADVLSRDHPESLVTPSPEATRGFQAPEAASGPSVSSIPPLQIPTLLPEKARQDEDSNPISEARRALQNEVSRPISEARTSFKPLVTKAQQQEVGKPAVRSVSRDDEAGQLQEPIEHRRQGREQEVVHKGVYKPLMAETLRGTAPPSIFGDKPNSFASAARKKEQEQRDVSRRGVGLPEVEPDEIQIHIGRIEVTALPQAPAPPAAKPAPKSANLDEYLKRRD